MSLERRLAREIAELRREVATLSRASQGAHRSIVNGALRFTDADGTVRQVVGVQRDGSVTTVDKGGDAPSAPSAPWLETQPGVLVATWDGTAADGTAWRADFRYVEVHVGAQDDYDTRPGASTTQVAEFPNTKGGILTLARPAGDVLVWLVAVSTAGVESLPSEAILITVQAPETVGGTAVYRTDAAPAGLGGTDSGVWYDTANGNLPYFWDVDHWEPMPVGPDAIQDAAIETRHVGKAQVNPSSMQVNVQGGAFANLVQDPSFVDLFFRNQRLADADPAGGWSFVQNTNLLDLTFATLTSGPWTGGPNTAIGTNYATLTQSFRTLTTPTAVALGETILVGNRTVPGLTTGRSYTLVVQPLLGTTFAVTTPLQTYDVGFQFTDSAGALLGSETLSAAQSIQSISLSNPAPVAVTAAAPAGAAGIRVTYRYRSGPSPYQAPVSSGTERAWAQVAYGPQATYNARLSLYGAEVGAGEWFAESFRTNSAVSGDTAARDLPIVTFNVDRNTLYEATWREQDEATGTYSGWAAGVLAVEFYDAAGSLLVAQSQSQGWRDAQFPEWAIKSNRFRAPAGAVTATAYLRASPPTGADGRIRFRMPQVQVAGWYDPDTGHTAWMSSAGIGFQKSYSAGGANAVDLFRLAPDYETDGALAYTNARWYFNDIVYVTKELQLQPGAQLTGVGAPVAYTPTLIGFTQSTGQAYFTQFGKTVFAWGSHTVAGNPSAACVVSLPVAAMTGFGSLAVGTWQAIDVGGPRYGGVTALNGTGNVYFVVNGSTGLVGSNNPHAWAAGDVLSWYVQYLAA